MPIDPAQALATDRDPYAELRASLVAWAGLSGMERNYQATEFADSFAGDLARALSEIERMRSWSALRAYVAHQDPACTPTACACGLDAVLAQIGG